MLEIATFEAAARFPELLQQIEKTGESIHLTRQGKTVAVISAPQDSQQSQKTVRKIWEDWWGLVKDMQLTPEDIASARAEGRR